MVETRIVSDADFRNEVTLTDALRDGLRELDAQGQIQPLLQARSWTSGRASLAIAAAMLACAIGVATFLIHRPSDDGRQVSTTQTLHFVQTRGGEATPDVTWIRSPEPTRIEMRLDVGVEPAAEYRVSIIRLSGDAPGQVFETLAALTGERDLVIAVDSALLAPGDYGVLLVPDRPGADQPEVHYRLRVAD